MQAGAVFNSQEDGRRSHPRHQTVLGRKAHPPSTGIDLETFRTAGSAKGLLCLLWAYHFMRRCLGRRLGRRHRINFLPYIALLTFTLRASTPLRASRKAAFGSQRHCAMLPGALGRLWEWYEIGKQIFRKHRQSKRSGGVTFCVALRKSKRQPRTCYAHVRGERGAGFHTCHPGSAPTVSCCSTQTCPNWPVRARNAELHVTGMYQSKSPCLASVRSCLFRACPARPKFHRTIQQA